MQQSSSQRVAKCMLGLLDWRTRECWISVCCVAQVTEGRLQLRSPAFNSMVVQSSMTFNAPIFTKLAVAPEV